MKTIIKVTITTSRMMRMKTEVRFVFVFIIIKIILTNKEYFDKITDNDTKLTLPVDLWESRQLALQELFS